MAISNPPMPPTPAVSAKEKAREAVERLANVQMNISLEEWGELSSAILAALSATEGEAEPVREACFEEMRRRMDQRRYVDEQPNSDWLPVDDTQVGIEFALEFLASRGPLYASPPSAPAGVKDAADAIASYIQPPYTGRHSDEFMQGWAAGANYTAERNRAAILSLQPDTQAAAASAPAQAEALPAGVSEAAIELLSHLKLYVAEKLEGVDADMLHDRMFDLTRALSSAPAQEGR